MKQALETDLPFGGLPVLFVGDFNQLGPVKKKFLPKDMLTWDKKKKQQRRLIHGSQGPNLNDPKQNNDIPECELELTTAERLLKNQAMLNKISKKKNKSKKKSKKPNACDNMTEDSLSCIGCELFSTFERHHLQESHRSKDDPKHSNLVTKLSSGTPITMEDLKPCKPLSKEDIATNPKDWKYDPILVSTNLEHMNICRQKSIMFAKKI